MDFRVLVKLKGQSTVLGNGHSVQGRFQGVPNHKPMNPKRYTHPFGIRGVLAPGVEAAVTAVVVAVPGAAVAFAVVGFIMEEKQAEELGGDRRTKSRFGAR